MDTYVFVYGTLKRGLYNHGTYLTPALALVKAIFMGTARTAHAEFHLALNDQVFYPCMYRAPTGLYHVPGEVYRVTDDVLAALDVLEEIDEGLYYRDDVAVELLEGAAQGKTLTCQTYVMAFRDELLTLEHIAEYTPEMNVRYAALMDEPQLAVLEWIYGRKIVRAVETELGDGMRFAEAWNQVIGSGCLSDSDDDGSWTQTGTHAASRSSQNGICCSVGGRLEKRRQANAAMETYVFVYGTLKRGLYNYETYLKPALALDKAELVGVGRTARADFHMALDDDEMYPCVYRAPAEGEQVPGEVYRVDADALQMLDILEEVNDGLYGREEVAVDLVDGERKGETLSCQAYLMAMSETLLKMERIPNYTTAMNAEYAALMGEPELEVLEPLYDHKTVAAVRVQLEQGAAFWDAWKQVLGQ